MSDSKPKRLPELEDDLGHALRAEADGGRPEFSDTLHARVMESLPSGPVVRQPEYLIERRRRMWLSGLIAAAAAVLVAVIAWQAGYFARMSPEHPETANEPTLDPAKVLTASPDGSKVGLMVDNTLTKSQWAYLDHDAKVAANLLMDQLPFHLASAEQNHSPP
jgi:hypothetical protein